MSLHGSVEGSVEVLNARSRGCYQMFGLAPSACLHATAQISPTPTHRLVGYVAALIFGAWTVPANIMLPMPVSVFVSVPVSVQTK